ncbi:MAG: hypothetical protein DRG80_05000, partial [Deltaproteobacteria bacterium]
ARNKQKIPDNADEALSPLEPEKKNIPEDSATVTEPELAEDVMTEKLAEDVDVDGETKKNV